MSGPEFVKTVVQTTADVEPARAFDYWRHTALAQSGIVSGSAEERRSFAARRLVALTADSTLFCTRSNKIGLERTPQQARGNGRDDVNIALLLRGSGYQEQGGRGASLEVGSVSFLVTDRPFFVGSHGDYEEIRLVTSRKAFQTHVGDPAAFAGRKIGGGALGELFATYLRAYAGTVARMTEAEAGVALEGALHLLRGLAGTPGGEPSTDALRSLAVAQIERRLHDPSFGPEALHRALNVSRSRLYAAFAGGEGVAAMIRDARLDRARHLLSSPAHDGESITATMYRCGFTDAPGFSRAFRRRFGLSPRDLRHVRRASSP